MKMRRFAVIASATVALFQLTANAAEVGIDVRFSTNEASIIRAYYAAQRPASKDKGNRGRALPPGIAKNLARGKSLPPGIAKKALPADLTGRLPPVRDGYERVAIDGKILLVEIATRVIHDVLEDVVIH